MSVVEIQRNCGKFDKKKVGIEREELLGDESWKNWVFESSHWVSHGGGTEKCRDSNVTFFFLGLEIDIKYNKWEIINEILIRILALMGVFFWPLDLLRSNGLKNV